MRELILLDFTMLNKLRIFLLQTHTQRVDITSLLHAITRAQAAYHFPSEQ